MGNTLAQQCVITPQIWAVAFIFFFVCIDCVLGTFWGLMKSIRHAQNARRQRHKAGHTQTYTHSVEYTYRKISQIEYRPLRWLSVQFNRSTTTKVTGITFWAKIHQTSQARIKIILTPFSNVNCLGESIFRTFPVSKTRRKTNNANESNQFVQLL